MAVTMMLAMVIYQTVVAMAGESIYKSLKKPEAV
jgi:hypothetical protein